MQLRTAIAGAFVLAVLSAGAAAAETPLERGTYLMKSIVACGNCHTPQTPQGPAPGREFAGGTPFVEEPAFTAYAPNITPDSETGIGGWTDAQLIKAIREGVRPDGSIIGPPMPIGLYRGLSDSDVEALVAYMRQVKPVRNEVQKSDYKIPLPPAYGPPLGVVADLDPADQVAYGAYLAGPAGHCIECHSPPGPQGPDMANNLGAGGFPFRGPWGISHSANITPTGLGDWSDAEIKQAVTAGIGRDGKPLMPPMGYFYYKNISAADLDAIVAYLRTLPPK